MPNLLVVVAGVSSSTTEALKEVFLVLSSCRLELNKLKPWTAHVRFAARRILFVDLVLAHGCNTYCAACCFRF